MEVSEQVDQIKQDLQVQQDTQNNGSQDQVQNDTNFGQLISVILKLENQFASLQNQVDENKQGIQDLKSCCLTPEGKNLIKQVQTEVEDLSKEWQQEMAAQWKVWSKKSREIANNYKEGTESSSQSQVKAILTQQAQQNIETMSQQTASTVQAEGVGSPSTKLSKPSTPQYASYYGDDLRLQQSNADDMGGYSARQAIQLADDAKADANRAIQEVEAMQTQIGQIQRQAAIVEASMENEAQTAAMMERLRRDMEKIETVQQSIQSTQEQMENNQGELRSRLGSALQNINDLTTNQQATKESTGALQDEVTRLEEKMEQLNKMSKDDMQEIQQGYDTQIESMQQVVQGVQQKIDLIRQVSSSTEKFAEDMSTEIQSLSAKVDNNISQSAALITPLNQKIITMGDKIGALQKSKLDKSNAVTETHVTNQVAAAVQNIEQNFRCTINTVVEIERKLEFIVKKKADREHSVDKQVFEKSLSSLAGEVKDALQTMQKALQEALNQKASCDDVDEIMQSIQNKVKNLENSIIKGLNTITDKSAAALSKKADGQALQNLALQVKIKIADLTEIIQSMIPGGRVTSQSKTQDKTKCLSCDANVKSPTEIIRAIHTIRPEVLHRLLHPSSIPLTQTWHVSTPQINSKEPLGASHNANLARQKHSAGGLATPNIQSPSGAVNTQSRSASPEFQNNNSHQILNLELQRTVSTLTTQQLADSVGQLEQSRGRTATGAGARTGGHADTVAGRLAAGKLPVNNQIRAPSQRDVFRHNSNDQHKTRRSNSGELPDIQVQAWSAIQSGEPSIHRNVKSAGGK